MRKFSHLEGVAAPLPLANVDTDKILAGQHLKTVTREGLGKLLFSSMRYHDDGSRRPGFILNKTPYDQACILIAYENFGCGSSREHAPWALLDFGIRCIIAPSFADIFYNNCIKNGILPIQLAPDIVRSLIARVSDREGARISVDLQSQCILASYSKIDFDIDPNHKKRLLEGLDDIAVSLRFERDIDAFEKLREGQAKLFPPISLNASELQA